MTRSFIYKDYAGEVKFPPDDFTELSALKPVKATIDAIFKSYNESNVKLPLRISGESGQIIWEAEYIQVSYA